MSALCPVAIVTGGSGGLAPGIVRALLGGGYAIFLVARHEGRLSATAETLRRENGGAVDTICCDVADTVSVDAMVGTVFNRAGRIDLLVNAAASSTPIGGAIEEVDIDAIVGDLDIKVGGYLRCIRAITPIMKRQKHGRIVNIGGLTGRSSDTLSGMRNAAVSHLTKVLADQLGPFCITVNALHPGLTRTPHLQELFLKTAQEQGTDPATVAAEWIRHIPTRRLTLPEEIGQAIAFLGGSHASSINGESITIDGGYSRGIYL